MDAMDILFCNKKLPSIEKKSPNIRELSDFDKIFIFNSLMNEFYNALVNLSKIPADIFGNLILPRRCEWRY